MRSRIDIAVNARLKFRAFPDRMYSRNTTVGTIEGKNT